MGADRVSRCWWATSDSAYRRYHDTEWGRPVADDRRLFEKLSLEGFMSGLSWLVILCKRDNFRAAFRDFEPEAIARFGAQDVARLMADAGIVRNRAKIEATINNATRHAKLVDEFGGFPAYVCGASKPGRRRRLVDRSELVKAGPSPEAVELSKDLRRRGGAFVGPTTVHSFMQAMGLVNDHVRGGREVERLRREFVRPG